jgi:type II secretory pathway pseudopilin PulG
MQIRGEIIITIIIAGLLSLAVLFGFVSGKTQASNQKVLTDVTQISSALKIYFQENGYYPYDPNSPTGLENYLSFWPKPANDGSCSKYTDYYYSQKLSGDDYNLVFCLSGNSNGYLAGVHTVSMKGIN